MFRLKLPSRRSGSNVLVGEARTPSLAQTASGFLISQSHVPVLSEASGVAPIHELGNLMVAGHFAEGRRGVAVCAAAEATGASFVATNLAAAIAGLGVQTLLLEANLRTPKLTESIRRPTPGPGLSEYLLDPLLTPSDIVTEEVIPNLRLVYAGQSSMEAVDLLSTDRFASLIATCLRDSTCTIVDTAPANRSADARTVAQSVGYALIIARRKRSFIEDVESLASQLAEDGVYTIGTILNAA